MAAAATKQGRPLLAGDSVPWFRAPTLSSDTPVSFETMGGRAIVMLFAGNVTWPACAAALEVVRRHSDLFDDVGANFFGVTCHADDVTARRVAHRIPGIRWFPDVDRRISDLYGATADETYRPHWLLLDRSMRVVMRATIDDGEAVMARLAALLRDEEAGVNAPVLIAPRVFEPELCRRLIALYDAHGGSESGFMRDVDGETRGFIDHRHKRRSDYTITDEGLMAELRGRLARFLVPAIERGFQFRATRIERWIVACYDDRDGGGHFGAHRDNTTLGTAHRRFACTINLDAEAYDGGDLSFPEFGPRLYRAPTGGAVIFSCSLLHKVDPVTRGRRFAFLPFFYDDAAAKVREANAAAVSGSNYTAG